jgi:hypothetical protein
MEFKERVIKAESNSIVKEIEEKYPEMTAEYKRIMMEGYETFCKKQVGYGPDNIALGTSLSTNSSIKLSITGIWFRCMDKVNRWKQLVINDKPDVIGESLTDTIQDLGVYCIIAQIVANKKWAK